jgi:hypothetical protein
MKVRMLGRTGVSAIEAGLKILFLAFLCTGVVSAQDAGADGKSTTTVTVYGRVLNKLTKEPIARALVTTANNEYAVMTDDRGEFGMKLVEIWQGAASPEAAQKFGGGSLGGGPRESFQAKKPGFVPPVFQPMVSFDPHNHKPLVIYLLPEARIVGHVNVPGTEGEVRIPCSLYRREIQQGRQRWQPAGSFTTWANGEFRFTELRAGTYRLITHEQMDRDSLMAPPGAEMLGYPPVYYPNTTDFSAASPIVVKPGETAEVNLTVQRRSYYPVRIPVGNAPQVAGVQLSVYPMGHWGPGWSLGYDPGDQAIRGLLPDGNYTVEAIAQGQPSETGIANFVVRGAPMEGSPLRLVPDPSIAVTVRTEFRAQQTTGVGDAGSAPNRGAINLGVSLEDTDENGSNQRDAYARPVEGSDNRNLMIDEVRPGRYRVTASAGSGYVASIESGGVDLMKQPLVVGRGASVPPIEITLRDDGAEVTATLDQAPNPELPQVSFMNGQLPVFYLIPTDPDRKQGVLQVPEWNGSSTLNNVPPGDYLAVVFDQHEPNLPTGDLEFLKSLEGNAQTVHLEAGQKVNLKLKVIPGGDE